MNEKKIGENCMHLLTNERTNIEKPKKISNVKHISASELITRWMNLSNQIFFSRCVQVFLCVTKKPLVCVKISDRLFRHKWMGWVMLITTFLSVFSFFLLYMYSVLLWYFFQYPCKLLLHFYRFYQNWFRRNKTVVYLPVLI